MERVRRARRAPCGPARARHGDDVAGDELTTTPFVGLTVDAHGAVSHELARLGTGLGEVGELEELTEPDGLVTDRHVVHEPSLAGRRQSQAKPATGVRGSD